MQSLKIIRRRIQSVRNTQKVTRAMMLVAAAKLKRAQREALAGRPYAENLHDIVKRVSMRAGPTAPPIMRRRADIKSFDVLTYTSDRGLCGGFNENLLMELLYGIDEHVSHGIGVKVYVIGKKGWQYLKRRYENVEKLEPKENETDDVFFLRIADLLTKRFLTGLSDGAFVLFNRFHSASRHEPTYWDLLPVHWRGRMPDRLLDYTYEPQAGDVKDDLCRQFLKRTIEQAAFETAASELAARMMAMDSATRNADEMIAHLTLLYNKARQSAITAELLDIIGGANALRAQ